MSLKDKRCATAFAAFMLSTYSNVDGVDGVIRELDNSILANFIIMTSLIYCHCDKECKDFLDQFKPNFSANGASYDDMLLKAKELEQLFLESTFSLKFNNVSED